MINFRALLFDNRSLGQTIFKNTFWLVFAEAISKILGVFIFIWIARYLGATNYGKFSFALAFTSLFWVIADFGFSILTTREIAKEKEKAKKYIDNILVMKFISGPITFFLIVFVVQFLGKTSEIENLVYLAGILLVINSFIIFFQAVFRGFEKMEYEAFSKIFSSVFLFIFIIIILGKSLKLQVLISVHILVALLTLIFILVLVRKKITRFWLDLDFKFWREIFSKSWPFALSGIAITIYWHLDSVMLSMIKGDQVVGWYNVAYRPIFFIGAIGGLLSSVFFPVISKLYIHSQEKLKEILNEYLRLKAVMALPIAFGGIMVAFPLINLVFGEEYKNSVLAFQILLLVALIIYINSIYGEALQACERQKILLQGVSMGAGVNIILNLILIPLFSLYGAALATLLTEVIVFIFLYLQVNKFITLDFKKHILKPLISSIIMCALLYLVKDWNVIILIFLGILYYSLIMLLIKGFTKKDLFFLRSLMVYKK